MRRHTLLLLTFALLPGAAHSAFAQAAAPSPLARGDVSGVAAWMHVDKSDASGRHSNDWSNRGFYGGGTAGWYWTDHHKTEIEAGATGDVRLYTYRTFVDNGVTVPENSELTFSTRRIAVGQHYQFYRNAWFHPHAGAGLDLTWERTTQVVHPAFLFTTQPGRPGEVRPGSVIGPDTALHVRPFGEVGFKAYVSPRAFVRSDLRLVARRGLDEVQLRFGLGVDF
jgi:hypothetical protein